MAHKTVESRRAIPDEIEGWVLAGQLLENLARPDVVAHVHERDGVIVTFFGSLEARRVAVDLLYAAAEMNARPVRQFGARTRYHFLEE